jgi:hypothetical protein
MAGAYEFPIQFPQSIFFFEEQLNQGLFCIEMIPSGKGLQKTMERSTIF